MKMTRGEIISTIIYLAYGRDLSEKENNALQMAIESISREEKAESIIWSSKYDACKIIELRKLYPMISTDKRTKEVTT